MPETEWSNSVEAFSLSLCSVDTYENSVKAKNEIKTKERDGYNDDASFYNIHHNPVLECDYDRGVHALYDAIEKKRWKDADRIFCDSELQEKTAEPDPSKTQGSSKGHLSRAEVLAKTWVYRTYPNSDGRIKWRITALHAAVIFDAPLDLFRKILEAHPASAKLRDDRGNLPIHLAFKTGLDEDRINILLDAYRDGLEVKNNKGLTPIDCVAFCRNEERRRPILTFISTTDRPKEGNFANEIPRDAKDIPISPTDDLEEQLPEDETAVLGVEARDSEQKVLDTRGELEEERDELAQVSEEAKVESENTAEDTGLSPEPTEKSEEAIGESEKNDYDTDLLHAHSTEDFSASNNRVNGNEPSGTLSADELQDSTMEVCHKEDNNNEVSRGETREEIVSEIKSVPDSDAASEADLAPSDKSLRQPQETQVTRTRKNVFPASDLKPDRQNKSVMKKGKSTIGRLFSSKSRKKEKKNKQQQQRHNVSQNSAIKDSPVVEESDSLAGGQKEGNDKRKQQHSNVTQNGDVSVLPVIEEHASSVASADGLAEEEKQALSMDQDRKSVNGTESETAGSAAAEFGGEHEVVQEKELVREAPSLLQQLSAIEECSPSMEHSSASGLVLNKDENISVLGALGLGPILMKNRSSDPVKDNSDMNVKGTEELNKRGVTASDSCNRSSAENQDISDGVTNRAKEDSFISEEDDIQIINTEQDSSTLNQENNEQSSSDEENVQEGTHSNAVALALSHSSSTEAPPPIFTVVSSTTNGDDDSIGTDMSPISTDTERMFKYRRHPDDPRNSRLGGGVCGVCWA